MAADTDPEGIVWRRPSPIAVVFYIVRYGRMLVTDGLPALAPLVAVWATTDGTWRTMGMLGIALLLVVGTLWAILSYLRFRFSVNGDQILIRRGVLHREQLNVDADRIQDVSIDVPFYARPFGLAILNLDTAGSAKKEIALAGLPLAEARLLRDQLVASARSARAVSGQDTGPEANEQEPASGADAESVERLLLKRSTADVARYGLTANGLLWVAILAGAFFSTVGDESWEAGSRWFINTLQLGGLLATVQSLITEGKALGLLLVAAGALLALLLLPLFSIIGALWKYANYELSVAGEIYRRHSGLVSRQEQTLRRAKVQAALWRQNLVACWLGRTNVQLRMVSAGEAVNVQSMNRRQPSFLLPALDTDQTRQFTAEFLPGCETGDVVFSAIHPRYIRRTIALGWLPPLAGLSIGATALAGWFALLVPLLGLPLAWACSRLRWKRYGYGINGVYGWLRDGFFGTRTTIFPLFKVQRVDLSQSPSQRRKGLANLTIHLASHSITMPYVALEDARRFMNLSLYHAESSTQAWF